MSTEPLPLDTGVLIALAAATGSWSVLNSLCRPIVITPTVMEEVRSGPDGSAGSMTPLAACMSVWDGECEISPYLLGSLDKGEASVIALALDQHWSEVAIDEAVGRSVAKTSRLRVTGSLGILIRAQRKGYPLDLADAIRKIRTAGIWISVEVEQAALKIANQP